MIGDEGCEGEAGLGAAAPAPAADAGSGAGALRCAQERVVAVQVVHGTPGVLGAAGAAVGTTRAAEAWLQKPPHPAAVHLLNSRCRWNRHCAWRETSLGWRPPVTSHQCHGGAGGVLVATWRSQGSPHRPHPLPPEAWSQAWETVSWKAAP